MENKILSILQDALGSLRSEIEQVDKGVEKIASTTDSKDNQAVAILLQGRGRLQAQVDEIERTIARITSIIEGNTPAPTVDGKSVIPGQYAGLKLSTAVQAYLSERGRGPISVAKLVQELIAGGLMIHQSRSKLTPGVSRTPDTRDLRLLAANNRKRFAYDSATDTLSLQPIPGNDTGWVKRAKRGMKLATVLA